MISKKFLSEVIGRKVIEVSELQFSNNCINLAGEEGVFLGAYNIYELAHKSLKEWAITKGIFYTIDWSGTPEQIFSKAEELREELK